MTPKHKRKAYYQYSSQIALKIRSLLNRSRTFHLLKVICYLQAPRKDFNCLDLHSFSLPIISMLILADLTNLKEAHGKSLSSQGPERPLHYM